MFAILLITAIIARRNNCQSRTKSSTVPKKNYGFRYHWIFCVLLSAFAITAVGGCEAIKSGSATVPVRTSVRNSYIGAGRVLQITNSSQRTILHLVVRIEAPDGSSVARRMDKRDPREMVELGWMEWNWSAEPGETVSVSASGFLPKIAYLR
jgi:hypothetical protein